MLEIFKHEIAVAIGKYGEDHIDVIKDKENSRIYATYHSDVDSFPVTHDYPLEMMSDDKMDKFCENRNIGYDNN